ncbi:MAG: hypothetical protein HF978_18895 [Desulfobacteraceae bacterium]|nr:hypothetical protein [Desulfobacteraceae bacterium]MBC2757616.1 hypothetical protein [Desulfobacteraceae bacterium]
MKNSNGERYVKNYSHIITASKQKVFPLLCPVKEYDWIDGWTCNMIYSESGFAEKDCIFTTNLPGAGDCIYVVSRFEMNERIEFVITSPGSHVEKLEIELEDCGEECTKLNWTRIYTSLTEKGQNFLEQYTTEAIDQRMEWIGRSLNHYCKTGELLLKK